jgi:hypothetical protein
MPDSLNGLHLLQLLQHKLRLLLEHIACRFRTLTSSSRGCCLCCCCRCRNGGCLIWG